MQYYADFKAKDRREQILDALSLVSWSTTMYIAKQLRASNSLNLLRLDIFKLRKAGEIEVTNVDHVMPHQINGYLRQKKTKLIAVRRVHK